MNLTWTHTAPTHHPTTLELIRRQENPECDDRFLDQLTEDIRAGTFVDLVTTDKLNLGHIQSSLMLKELDGSAVPPLPAAARVSAPPGAQFRVSALPARRVTAADRDAASVLRNAANAGRVSQPAAWAKTNPDAADQSESDAEERDAYEYEDEEDDDDIVRAGVALVQPAAKRAKMSAPTPLRDDIALFSGLSEQLAFLSRSASPQSEFSDQSFTSISEGLSNFSDDHGFYCDDATPLDMHFGRARMGTPEAGDLSGTGIPPPLMYLNSLGLSLQFQAQLAADIL